MLLVSCVFPPEPVVSAKLSEDIYYALKEKKCEVKVLHPIPTRPNGFCFDKSVKVSKDEIIVDSYVCPRSSLIGRFRESWSFGKETKSYIKKHHEEIDLIYANTWPLFAQYFLAIAAKKYSIPYYIHVQDIYPESYCHKMPKIIGRLLHFLLLPIDRYVLKNARGVFAISPAMKSYLATSRGVSDSRIVLIRNWQDDRSFIESHKPTLERRKVFQVMYLGSINPTANVSLILHSIAKLDKSVIHMSVIGNGPEKKNCQELATKLNLDVTFDSVVPEQVAIRQSEADILVLCLKSGVAQTATPSKLTAYMLTGRPIIASVDLQSDCANIIKESGCGIVVEPDNDEVLANAIYQMSTYSLLEVNKMGNAAFEYAMKHLSKEQNLNILIKELL